VSPIVRLALAFCAGDLAGLLVPGSTFGPVALAAASLVIVPGLLGRARGPVLLLGFVLLGAGTGGIHAEHARRDCRTAIPDGSTLTIEGIFDGVVAPDTTALLVAESVTLESSRLPCRGTVRVRVPQRAWHAVPRDGHVRVTGRWFANPPDRFPVPPDRRGSLAADTLYALASGHGHPLLVARAAAQRRLRALFGDQAGLAEALLLARREALDTDVRDDFAKAGLAHMLAISGAHVGIIAAVLLLVMRVLRIGADAAATCAALGTGLYILFLGAPHAAARAGLQAVLLLVARRTQRPADPLALLAVAGLVLLAVDGLALLDAGFQLSFAGMYGIIAWRSAIGSFMRDHVRRAATPVLTTTLAATLATAPIAALHFGMVSTIGPVANLLAAPLIGLCIPAIAASLITGLANDAAATFLAAGARVPMWLLDAVAHNAARVPGGHGAVSSTAIAAWLAGGLAFLASVRLLAPARTAPSRAAGGAGRRMRLALRVSAGIAAWSIFPLVAARGPGRLEIHAIDVGQGDAVAIQSPSGRWLLVDAGPRSDRFDAGRAIVIPFLLRHGVDRLDALILTHPDEDHIGGAHAVLEQIEVGLVIDPGVATGKNSFLALIDAARTRHIPWIAGRAGREIQVDGMTLRFLAPDAVALDAPAEANDYSLIFRLEYGGFSALFTGDAPRSAENRLVAAEGTGIASTVLKVGHHGSSTSTGDSVLAAVRPAIGLISVGRRNRYGHPDPQVLARLRENGVQVHRTDLTGTLTITAWPDGRFSLGAARR